MTRDPLLQPFRLKHLTLKNRIMSHGARAGLRRGRPAQGPLPALPRREGQGRHRADHDRGLGGGRRGFAAGVRQPARVPGRDRALAAAPRRRLPRARRRGDDPDHPSRPAHQLEPGRLAAGARALADPRAGAPLVPQGGRGLGHRAHRRGVRRRRGAHAGGRPRWHRDRGLRPPSGRLLVARDQPARPTTTAAAWTTACASPSRCWTRSAPRSAPTSSSASAWSPTRTGRRASRATTASRSPGASSPRGQIDFLNVIRGHIETDAALAEGDPDPGHAGGTPSRLRGRGARPRPASRCSTPRASTTSRPRATRSPRASSTWSA